MDVEVLRSELMKFSKEELVTELLAALLELAKVAPKPPPPPTKKTVSGGPLPG